MTRSEKEEQNIKSLPGDIMEAVNLLLEDDVIREVLGSHVLSKFVQAKQAEWSTYKAEVHQWELDNYLRLY